MRGNLKSYAIVAGFGAGVIYLAWASTYEQAEAQRVSLAARYPNCRIELCAPVRPWGEPVHVPGEQSIPAGVSYSVASGATTSVAITNSVLWQGTVGRARG